MAKQFPQETQKFFYYLDIEVVPQYRSFNDMPARLQDLFTKRFKLSIEETFKLEAQDQSLNETELHLISIEKVYQQKASLHAEFGKVVCVTIGVIKDDKEGRPKLWLKTFAGRHEREILSNLRTTLNAFASGICAHNGKEFDFPFLFRRYIILGIPLPHILNTIGKKPWDVALYDTMEMWSSTAWNYKVSLDLLCEIFGIDSPKSEITGADIASVYYGMFDELGKEELPFEKENEALGKISSYNQRDVVALAKCDCKINNKPMPESIQVHVDEKENNSAAS